ncbi:MAG: M81 family metallopeptidase, partial [Chloroflexota bacterium]
MRVAVLGMRHETNTFAVERNDTLDVPTQMGEEVLAEAHPKSYIGGFAEAAEAADVELVPVGNVNFVAGGRGGIITAEVYTHYRDLFLDGLREAGPLDGVYFALHGAMAVEEPYMEAEADLLRSARELLGNETPFVATYDFHSNYAEGECDLAVPVPLNSNPHIDAYERGMEAADLLLRMQAGDIAPVTRFVRVPILGPNVGQSTWSHLPNDEMRLPLYHLNLLREDWEKKPGVLNLTIQGGYGYSDIPYAGMSVIATTDGDPVLAEQLARDMAQELWDRREEIRTVRPILPIERGIEIAMRRDEGLVCLVDLGDDPGSLCPADSPAVLEALLRLGARDCALTIRDENVVEAGLEAGVGATLKMEVGA